MVPQSFRDILASGEHVGLFQTIAMLIFILFFLGLVFYVLSRPKKHYTEEENAPLDEDSEFLN